MGLPPTGIGYRTMYYLLVIRPSLLACYRTLLARRARRLIGPKDFFLFSSCYREECIRQYRYHEAPNTNKRKRDNDNETDRNRNRACYRNYRGYQPYRHVLENQHGTIFGGELLEVIGHSYQGAIR